MATLTTVRSYVCSMPVKPDLPKLESNGLENSYKCADGWISWGLSCYQFNTDKMSYSDAKSFCESQTSSLKNGKGFYKNEGYFMNRFKI